MSRSKVIQDIFKDVKNPFEEYWKTKFLSLVSDDCLRQMLKCPSVNGIVDLTALPPEFSTEIENLYDSTKKKFEAENNGRTTVK